MNCDIAFWLPSLPTSVTVLRTEQSGRAECSWSSRELSTGYRTFSPLSIVPWLRKRCLLHQCCLVWPKWRLITRELRWFSLKNARWCRFWTVDLSILSFFLSLILPSLLPYSTTVGSLYMGYTPRGVKVKELCVCFRVWFCNSYFVFFLADAQVKGMFYLLYYSLLSCRWHKVFFSFFPLFPNGQMAGKTVTAAGLLPTVIFSPCMSGPIRLMLG